MYCTTCGKKIEEDSRFCPYCGANQEIAVVENTFECDVDNEDTAGCEIVMTVRVPWNSRSEKVYIYVDSDEYFVIPKKSNILTVRVTPEIHFIKVSSYKNGWAEKMGRYADEAEGFYNMGILRDMTATLSLAIRAVGGLIGLMYKEFVVDLSDGGSEHLKIKINAIGIIKITRE